MKLPVECRATIHDHERAHRGAKGRRDEIVRHERTCTREESVT
jgi:hypothetical protein